VPYRRQLSRVSALMPLGVPNQMLPSTVSTIAVTLFDVSPFAVPYVVRCPLWIRLTPPLSVPAHTAPSRARYTEYTLFWARPSVSVNRSLVKRSPRVSSRITPPRCRPAHTSPSLPVIE
jgi:hypothetical protein